MDDKDLKQRGMRGWRPIGFLIMICQCGLDAVTTASDCRKRFIIDFIEKHYHIPCGFSTWSSLGLDMQVRLLRLINDNFSKTSNSWRWCIQKAVYALLHQKRDDDADPVLGFFQVRAAQLRSSRGGGALLTDSLCLQNMLGVKPGRCFLHLRHPLWRYLRGDEESDNVLFQTTEPCRASIKSLAATSPNGQRFVDSECTM